ADRAGTPHTLDWRATTPPQLVAAFFTYLDADGYTHEFVCSAKIAVRLLDIHHIGDLSAAATGDQRQGRLLHHCRINLSKPERLINIGAEGRKAHPIGIRASLSHQVDAQSMVGRPETGDSDCTVFEILQATNLLRRFWRRCECKERH